MTQVNQPTTELGKRIAAEQAADLERRLKPAQEAYDKSVAEKEAKAKALAAQQAKADADRMAASAAAKEKDAKDRARMNWVMTGGNDQAFEAAWPAIWQKILADAALPNSETDRQRKAEAARVIRNMW